jgi:hypothetical protein
MPPSTIPSGEASITVAYLVPVARPSMYRWKNVISAMLPINVAHGGNCSPCQA